MCQPPRARPGLAALRSAGRVAHAPRCFPGRLRGDSGLQRGQAGGTLSCKVPALGTSWRFPGSCFCRDPRFPGRRGAGVPLCGPILRGGCTQPRVQEPPQTQGSAGSRVPARAGRGVPGRARRTERRQQLGWSLGINRHSRDSGEPAAGAGGQPSPTGSGGLGGHPTGLRRGRIGSLGAGNWDTESRGAGAGMRGTGVPGCSGTPVSGTPGPRSARRRVWGSCGPRRGDPGQPGQGTLGAVTE